MAKMIIVNCDGPNCVTDEKQNIPNDGVMPVTTYSLTSDWIIIDLKQERQGTRGGVGVRIFCSWKCVSNWALG